MIKMVLYGVSFFCHTFKIYTHYEMLQIIFLDMSVHGGQTKYIGVVLFPSGLYL